MFKKVHQYMWNERYTMSYYLDNEKDIIERVAFIFLCIIYCICFLIVFLALFASCPIWIIPYLIYKKRKK